jgi:hypothetical protein
MGMYIPNMKSEQFYDLCKEHGLEIIAVPVPPHGRLIDADALKSDGFNAVVCYTGKMPYEYTAMRIDDAPTIIPASGGKEDE